MPPAEVEVRNSGAFLPPPPLPGKSFYTTFGKSAPTPIKKFPEYFNLQAIPLLRSRFHPFKYGWEANLADVDMVLRGICGTQSDIRLSSEQARIVRAACDDLRAAIAAFEAYSFQYDQALTDYRRGHDVPSTLPASIITCLSASLNQMEQAAARVQTIAVFCLDNSVRQAPTKGPDDILSQLPPDGYKWYEELVSAYYMEYGSDSPLLRSQFCKMLRRAARVISLSHDGACPLMNIPVLSNSASYRRLANVVQHAVEILGGPCARDIESNFLRWYSQTAQFLPAELHLKNDSTEPRRRSV
mmetsp:Transcript_40955/g.66423  ORF Transcript_40955/g.66423 Transcript_40955/m.66423 type:complete len:300 (-) Transcript_40955:924-1823(-)|eukprot:CAMPEP_0184649548 /NCGR_PEP_ID=MMETSP0308-20130426/6946_1 /TAXON_ID=38269 /ORGANISM="Gloeochaete witrockiana, Strain SAG 46.84" /LENGTH=299 /DNA_ID=CAMNT_0027082373 /DNA_START=61 /DNA_END=960 /DNA_ORIENTATION=+